MFDEHIREELKLSPNTLSIEWDAIVSAWLVKLSFNGREAFRYISDEVFEHNDMETFLIYLESMGEEL